MPTVALIPGAGGAAWYWSRVKPLLEGAGYKAVAVDLPGNDNSAGLQKYAEIVVNEVAGERDLVLVAQSLGGFTAPLVCARAAVRTLIFVNAMIPCPGETAGDWWDNVGARDAQIERARREGYSETFDAETYFLHDVSAEIASEGAKYERQEAGASFSEPCTFDGWPPVPIYVVAGEDDRFFPLEFQRRIARKRLAAEVDTLPGGHLIAL